MGVTLNERQVSVLTHIGGKMKNLIGLLLLLPLIIGGCATQNTWVHSTKTQAEAQKDFMECQYDAEKHGFVPYGGGTSAVSAGIQEGVRKVQLMSSCMTSKGYYLANRQALQEEKDTIVQSQKDMIDGLKNGRYDKTLEIANELIARYPDFPLGYFGRGWVNIELGKSTEALADFSRVSSMKLDAIGLSHAVVGRTTCLVDLGELDVSLQVVNERLSSDSSNASLYNIRAYVLIKKGEYDKAIEDCNKSLSLDMSKPNAFKNRGLAYLGKLEFEKAVEQFNKSLAIDASYREAFDGRGEAYLKLGKNDDATAEFKKACELGKRVSCNKVK